MRTSYAVVRAGSNVIKVHGHPAVPGLWYVVRTAGIGLLRNTFVVGGPYSTPQGAKRCARVFRESAESAREPEPEENDALLAENRRLRKLLKATLWCIHPNPLTQRNLVDEIRAELYPNIANNPEEADDE